MNGLVGDRAADEQRFVADRALRRDRVMDCTVALSSWRPIARRVLVTGPHA
jgi:hypothetical protein